MILAALIELLLKLLEFLIDLVFKIPGVNLMLNGFFRALKEMYLPSDLVQIVSESLLFVISLESAIVFRKWFRKWLI